MIDELLKGINDDLVLKELLLAATPLEELMEGYKKITQTDDTLAKLADDWTGLDLKEALKNAPVEKVLPLLYKFQKESATNGIDWSLREDPAKREERHLRHWITKVLVITACIVILIVAGAAIALGVMTGKLTDGPFVGSILKVAMEIIKIVFSQPPI